MIDVIGRLNRLIAALFDSTTAFGEILSAELTPIVQLQFPYNINTEIVDTRANQSGTVTQASNMAHLSTAAATYSSAQLLSKDHIKYNPGEGGLVRFTGVFTIGVVGSTQIIGIGDSGDGYFFGYNGADFGVLRRKGGTPEVRTLTIGTKSSHVDNVTITLDGDPDTTVVVSNGADKTVTANEIADNDYSDIGRGWTAEAVGDTVIFYSWDSSPRTGTYSLADATSAIGTFARSLPGVAPTDTWVAQTAWSEDKAAGAQTLPVMDFTKGNVFQIRYQWLGFGLISFWIENPSTGVMVKVHQVEYANVNTSPSINNPTLPLCSFAGNTSNASDITIDIGSMAGFVEGKDELLGTNRGVKNNKTNAGATEIPILTIRNKTIYQSTFNRTRTKLLSVGMSVEHSKPVTVNFYRNPILTAASYSDVDTATSVMQADVAATAFSGGTLLFSVDLAKEASELIDLSNDKHIGILLPGNHITATSIPNSGNSSETNVTFSFVELF